MFILKIRNWNLGFKLLLSLNEFTIKMKNKIVSKQIIIRLISLIKYSLRGDIRRIFSNF